MSGRAETLYEARRRTCRRERRRRDAVYMARRLLWIALGVAVGVAIALAGYRVAVALLGGAEKIGGPGHEPGRVQGGPIVGAWPALPASMPNAECRLQNAECRDGNPGESREGGGDLWAHRGAVPPDPAAAAQCAAAPLAGTTNPETRGGGPLDDERAGPGVPPPGPAAISIAECRLQNAAWAASSAPRPSILAPHPSPLAPRASPLCRSPRPSPLVSLAPLLDAMTAVESGGRADAIGDGGRSIGPLQIQRAYWADARMDTGRYDDCRDAGYARQVVLAYWDRYAPSALRAAGSKTRGARDEGRVMDAAEVLARTHNGGPRGAQKAATAAYWNKVQAAMTGGGR